MKFLRIITILLLAAAVMVACLLWVAQFFGGDEDVTPVIWLERMGEESQNSSDEEFVEWEDDNRRRVNGERDER